MNANVMHFDVQLSEPYEHAAYGQPDLMVTSHRNVTLDVLTTSAQRAIELALERHPAGIVHVIQRRGTTNMLMDVDIVKELIDADPTILDRP